MRGIALLVVLAAAVHLLPIPLSLAGLGRASALEYVAYGIEAAALWWAVGLAVQRMDLPRYLGLAGAVVCIGGVMESALRPICRLMFALDRPPLIQPGAGLCTAAGMPMAHWTPLWAMGAAFCMALWADQKPVRLYR